MPDYDTFVTSNNFFIAIGITRNHYEMTTRT